MELLEAIAGEREGTKTAATALSDEIGRARAAVDGVEEGGGGGGGGGGGDPLEDDEVPTL